MKPGLYVPIETLDDREAQTERLQRLSDKCDKATKAAQDSLIKLRFGPKEGYENR